MRKFIEKLICKNMPRFLKIYQKSIRHNRFNFKSYLDRTIFFEIDYLIRLIIEKNEEDEEKW